MKPVDRSLQKLLKAAARAPREAAGPPPFALEAAVISHLCNAGPEEEFARLMPLFRYAMVFGLAMMLVSGAWNYFEGERSSGATALARYALTQMPP
jgi:hypothetical protein